MSPSQQCREKGLSLAEFIRLSKVPERTIINWHKTKQHLFSLVLAGVVVTKQNGGEA